ncbi:hypothetical protein LPJ73_002095 [Coemansia sp. RSA 2703]|nr:hypothetical protein LPJ73_002095 [Coemansia sp. RSA 2703]KAJ2376455.1 hypothetical protein IW150_001977 [Coemansia sp. RSA 2607]KAJ2397528.1 hypothetical protein GGI05_000599 [Coemansia sp. RSA 2603]
MTSSFETDLDEYLSKTDRNTTESGSVKLDIQAQCPDGFVVSADPRYAYSQDLGLWLDLQTGVLSCYDTESQTYVNVQQSTEVDKDPESVSVLRLVVLESDCLAVNSHIDISDLEELGIGRDWPSAKTRHLRIPDIGVSRFHAKIYVSELEETDTTAADDAGSEDGEIEDTVDKTVEPDDSGNLSEGECVEENVTGATQVPLSDQKETGVYIIDQGSTHGTFVNNYRLSEPKAASKPRLLQHMDLLTIGQTKLQIHIHQQWACSKCSSTGENEISTLQTEHQQPASVHQPTSNALDTGGSQETRQTRADILNQIKRKYMAAPRHKQSGHGNLGAARNASYVDRAKLRREMQSGHAEHSSRAIKKPPAPSESYESTKPGIQPIEESNPGFSMLQKMGWTPGSGLGSDKSGIVDPVEVQSNSTRSGLGMPAPSSQAAGESRKEWIARLTKERFDSL